MEGSVSSSEQGVSKRYMIFLVVVMGLVSQMDSWLSLIETKALPGIITEFWAPVDEAARAVARSEFAFLQGVFGIIVFGVFFIAWFADAYGRRAGIMVLVLTMGIPSILIVFLSINVYIFLLLYSVVIMATTSNLWEVPVSEEAPAKSRGLYGSIAFLIGVIPLYAILGTRIIDSFGWVWGYGVMFFLMLILMVLLYFMKEPQRWKDSVEARQNLRLGVMQALRKLRKEDRKYIIIATIVYLAWTISFKMATTFGGEYFVQVLNYTDDEFNSILTIAGLLLPVSALISGILLDKGGRNLVLVLGSLGSVVSLAALGLTGLPITYQLAYFFMAMVLAWIYVYLAEIFTTEVRSTSIGVCVTGARLGYVVGPLLSSLLISMFPVMDGFWIVAGVLMLIPLFTLLARPLETKGKTLEEIEVER
ncbi:MFS transporter [Candidatus Thorarchaeota archaeon]|nr:MAG: MFS transporter [Candidatus Thorarchaeota archaeon]